MAMGHSRNGPYPRILHVSTMHGIGVCGYGDSPGIFIGLCMVSCGKTCVALLDMDICVGFAPYMHVP